MNKQIDKIFQQVLDEDCADPLRRFADLVRQDERQALAQPKQEPVGWFAKSWQGVYVELMPEAEDAIPFYTAPPKREWVGLTDDERRHFNNRLSGSGVAEEIEAKLKEKNGGFI